VSLVRTGFIPVPAGAKPGFDHADVYRAGRRMYVAHTGADRVEVLDCDGRHSCARLRTAALGWWWADPAAAIVIVIYGAKERPRSIAGGGRLTGHDHVLLDERSGISHTTLQVDHGGQRLVPSMSFVDEGQPRG
jgi:hypothetical protein